MIELLLYFSLVYLLVNSAIFVLNLKDFKPLSSASEMNGNPESPLVSICIPARNEEHTIARVLNSVLNQSYSNLEILVLDDESTDKTGNILREYQKNYPEYLSVIHGKQKPANWLGKSWACHQLSQKARGEILFFIDADVWLNRKCVKRVINSMHIHTSDFLTVWPVQVMRTFWEHAVIPLVYYGLLSLLPVRWVHQKPKWLPPKFDPYFAAACGQCMVFKRAAYQSIGGHRAVKNKIVEDVAFARTIKRKGFNMRMYHGNDAIWCRMYTSAQEMWNGFRKNFLALYNNSIAAFVAMALVNFIAYVLPFIVLPVALFTPGVEYTLLSLVGVLLILSQRLILAFWYNWSKAPVLWHPLGCLWFHGLGLRVLWDYFFGRRAQWKNRPTDIF